MNELITNYFPKRKNSFADFTDAKKLKTISNTCQVANKTKPSKCVKKKNNPSKTNVNIKLKLLAAPENVPEEIVLAQKIEEIVLAQKIEEKSQCIIGNKNSSECDIQEDVDQIASLPKKVSPTKSTLMDMINAQRIKAAVSYPLIKNESKSTSVTAKQNEKLDKKLPLSTKYESIFDIFKYSDHIVSIYFNRKEICWFDKLKEGVEQMRRKKFTSDHLGQIITVYPEAYKISLERFKIPSQLTTVEKISIKPNFTNTVNDALGNVFNSQILIQRRAIFYQNLVTRMKQFHKSFLLQNNLFTEEYSDIEDSPGNKITKWHPTISIEAAPLIESAPLPKSASNSDVLASATFNKITASMSPRTRRAIGQVEKLHAMSPISPFSLRYNNPNKSTFGNDVSSPHQNNDSMIEHDGSKTPKKQTCHTNIFSTPKQSKSLFPIMMKSHGKYTPIIQSPLTVSHDGKQTALKYIQDNMSNVEQTPKSTRTANLDRFNQSNMHTPVAENVRRSFNFESEKTDKISGRSLTPICEEVNDDAKASPYLKGVSPSLIQMVRAKEAQRNLIEMTRNETEDSYLQLLQKLPMIIRCIHNLYTSEGKSALQFSYVNKRVKDSIHSVFLNESGKTLQMYLKTLKAFAPGWFEFLNLRNDLYLKIDRNGDLKPIIDIIQSELKEKMA